MTVANELFWRRQLNRASAEMGECFARGRNAGSFCARTCLRTRSLKGNCFHHHFPMTDGRFFRQRSNILGRINLDGLLADSVRPSTERPRIQVLLPAHRNQTCNISLHVCVVFVVVCVCVSVLFWFCVYVVGPQSGRVYYAGGDRWARRVDSRDSRFDSLYEIRHPTKATASMAVCCCER